MAALTPQRILAVGMGFWPAKVLLSAVEVGLHPRAIPDFPDALVALT